MKFQNIKTKIYEIISNNLNLELFLKDCTQLPYIFRYIRYKYKYDGSAVWRRKVSSTPIYYYYSTLRILRRQKEKRYLKKKKEKKKKTKKRAGHCG